MPIQGKKLFIDGKNTTLLQGLLGFHYRYVGSGKASILYDNISSEPAAWVSKRTKDLFAALPENIITANDLKAIQIKINKAKTEAEKIEIAKNNIDKINQHQIDVDAVYYANQSLLSDYVYSAKNELDLIDKIDYVVKIKSTNSNNVNGDRALVKVNGFYIGPEGIKVKLEHVKTSSQQSIQGLEQILSGDIETSITNDFEGVYGFELDNKGGSEFGFSKIDKAGKTNTSQYYRFNNPVDSKNYILAEYDFEGTIADKNILSIVNKEKKAETIIKNGEQAVANDPSLIPTIKPDLSKDFNIILEESEGIGQDKVYSDIGARKSGRTKGRYKFFMPPGAQDFELLIYNFLGKGKLGEKQKRFFEENLFKPYSKGIAKMENYRAQLMNDFEALKKLMPGVNTKLGDKIKGLEYTNSQAIRVFLWHQSGFDIPGISKTDRNKLLAHVNKNPDLKDFAKGLTALSKQDQWAKPDAYWDTGSIIKDVNDLVGKIGRKQQLEQFVANADVIFSKDNLNKIEAVYGIELREALQDILYRMKNGTNRPSNADRLTNGFTNWLNNSVGAIMFMNTKSATLQLLSMLNYINHRENNPLAVAKAVLNVKQYSKDVYTILSSPKIKRRFAGEGRGVNEAEISSAVSGSTNKMSAMISYLLKIGFTPTRAADAAAIGLGGAPYYRNKINAYKKQGLSDKEAETRAWDDFSETTEKFQQSSDPMLISQQQASILGRFILAFQNTPMQYTRSMVKDGKDLTNRRRIPGLTQSESDRVYISRILYYGAVQNFMFAALSNALFALVPGFNDDGEELDEKEKLIQNKQIRIANNMVDTVLRGSGVYGAIASTLKNVALKYYQEESKTPFSKDHRNTLLEIMNLSPPVGSKFRKINNALKIKDWDDDIIEKRGWDVMMDGRVNLSPSYAVLGNVVEGVTNIPLARTVEEIARLSEMLDARNSSMQRIALGLGWRTWDVKADNEEHDLIKIETKETKEQQRKQKVIDDRAEKKRLAEEARFEGMSDKEVALTKRKDEIFKTTSKEQKTLLLDLGLTKSQVKGLKYEKERVNKIIELLDKEKNK
jgi:hypothetical protein